MSWLAKFNLNILFKRLGTFRATLLLLALIVTCLYCGYRVGNFFHAYQQQTLEQQQQRLSSLYAELDEKVKHINTLSVELEVERMANQRAQNLVKEIEEKQFQLKKQLAFYEKVVAPEKEADGLVVDDVVITPTASANHYRFRVVLVQQKIRKRFAKGYVDMTFFGSMDEKPVSLSLSKVSSIADKSLKFSFQYFQIIEGDITLPENFFPEKLVLTAVLPKGKWQDYNSVEQNYAWPELVEPIAESTALILD
ncbi:DUF6776 family protein [Thalassotalea marina]|uniref:Uncharacterized protein n=1 Tax=Thalassotalea marina TaxID=1673741 RepID=A0A919BEG2_9GAMM|nr:DUF6776 family protein [Thalassotalea marina]GHF82630.1 hypothetical protein GCM10017161_07290 [Thalassotalea marina]